MTTLQDKTNTTGVQSPGNQIQFSRGGIAKKKNIVENHKYQVTMKIKHQVKLKVKMRAMQLHL